MRTTYSLGRVAGIQIGLNWSVLALLALLLWTLATSIFPDTNPGHTDSAYYAMAVVAALGFFASILLHELGHALQAKRDGMEIDGITLWMFGGVARFGGMFPTAGAEFRIAVAGPLVSLALAGACIGGAFIPGIPDTADGVLSWLGIINGVLLVFNLIPALPLDGGRMLRSALWAWKGDLRVATRLAAGAGRILALCMVGAGIALAITGEGIDGVWLAFIGWFVLQAAGAEARMVAAEAAPRPGLGIRVRDLMDAHPATIAPDATLEEFAREALRRPHGEAYVVVENGVPVGVVPTACLDELPRTTWAMHRVADCMVGRAHIPTVGADGSLDEAMEALRRSPLRRALVEEDGDLAGLLSLGDVARTLGLQPIGPVG